MVSVFVEIAGITIFIMQKKDRQLDASTATRT